MIKTVLVELPPLIHENDLLLAQYALKLTTSICEINPTQSHLDRKQIQLILNKVLELILSPLLQGTALEAVIEFLRALVPQCITYKELVQLLIEPVYSRQTSGSTASAATNSSADHHQQHSLVVHKQAFYSIAKSFAALTVANLQESNYFVKKFQDDLHDSKCSDSIKILALLCLGETGKTLLISAFIIKSIDHLFSSSSRKIYRFYSNIIESTANSFGNLFINI